MINVTKTFLPSFEEYTAILRRAWDKGWITRPGDEKEKRSSLRGGTTVSSSFTKRRRRSNLMIISALYEVVYFGIRYAHYGSFNMRLLRRHKDFLIQLVLSASSQRRVVTTNKKIAPILPNPILNVEC